MKSAISQEAMSDDLEAARIFKLAANQGYTLAQCSLRVFYEEGFAGLPQDDRQAARLSKLAADQESTYKPPRLFKQTEPTLRVI